MKGIFVLTLLMFALFGCRAVYDVQWEEMGDDVIIQIENLDPNIDMYYAEIILESGSRIAVKLGKHDCEGNFRIKNTFG